MARKASKTLTEGELRIMNVLWQLKEASTREITEVLQESESVAYNTVQTMLRILEQKGYVTHTNSGRTFVFKPAVERNQAGKQALKVLMAGFFDDSPHALMANLLHNEDLDLMEIEKLKEIINKTE